MDSSKRHIVLVAGEASGDLHASHLVEELNQSRSDLTFSGLGGPKMKERGVDIFFDLTQLAVVGFWEVLKHYLQIRKVFYQVLAEIKTKKPAVVILVDYPGFNLRLAKKIKGLNTKVIYYISPQVWAWKAKRVHLIKKYVNQMLVLFPFEKDFYAQYNIDVTLVGHPLIDIISTNEPKEQVLPAAGLKGYKMTIGILPGSREKEVERHLSLMLEAAQILYKDFPMIQCLICKAPSISRPFIEKHLQRTTVPFAVIEENIYEGINTCDICMVASGTATLETAILQKPMVVVYKTSLLTWLLAKLFVKIPNIALVNVIAGKQIVPECVQHQARASHIAKECKDIFTNEVRISTIKDDLADVKKALGGRGAIKRAAQEILRSLD